MAVSLEQYVAEATKAYEPAKTAINTQLGALDSNYNTGEQKINRNYQQQQAGLNNQRNMAAEAASMQAAGSGGSFGGAANLANRKYYDQTFVPAQTQMNTNKSNELDALRQNIENQRTSLNSQLANIDAQANQAALQQYWAAVEAEKQREAQLRAQREAQAAQNAYNRYLMEAMKNQNQAAQSQKANTSFTDWINNYSGWNNSKKNTWTTALNAVNSGKNPLSMSFFGNSITNTIANNLPNTAEYKDYLRWRNS
jgi:hypothetical protein